MLLRFLTCTIYLCVDVTCKGYAEPPTISVASKKLLPFTVKLPPTVKAILLAVAVAPVSVPPDKGKYGPPITVDGSTHVGALPVPFDFNMYPLVPAAPLNWTAPVESTANLPLILDNIAIC